MTEQTTAARPIGQCPNCGGQRYELLVHYCGTVRIGYPRWIYDASAPVRLVEVTRP